jgi:cytochrome c553
MRILLRRVGLGVAALLVVLLLVAGAAAMVGSRALARTYSVTPAALVVPTDSASVARGAHLAGIYGCMDCHGDDLSGRVMVDEAPFRVVASNLTPAGVGGAYTATDWDRAIRHGVRPDGTALFIMPSSALHGVSDVEAAALIAYLQALQAVESDLPATEWRLPGRLLAAGPIDLAAGVHPEPTPATSPEPDSTEAYGAYVANMMCAHCHGADLRGGQDADPKAPFAPDLRAAGAWPAEQFHHVLTTGITPDGRQLDPAQMPWTATARMTPAEREGVRRYLASLSPTPA